MNRKGGILLWVVGIILIAGIAIGWWLFSPDAEDIERSDVVGAVGDVLEKTEILEKDDSEEEIIFDPDSEERLTSGNPGWMEEELVDIGTGEIFRISQFEGKPILLESFAVWCPKCTQQQNKIKDLHEIVGDEVVSISLNTDSNEDEETVRNHIESNGFDWYYAISNEGLTNALIDEFGTGIVSAPSVPIVLICEDLSFRKLSSSGSRDVNELQAEIAAGCA